MQNTPWTTGKLFNTASGYWQPCALHAGVKLDIFTILGDARLSAKQVAEQLGASLRGTTLLLNALTAMGLLLKRKEQYANTEFSRKALHRESPEYAGHIVQHHHHLVDGWAQLDQAVRSGRPVEKRSHGEEKERESFLMGMFDLAMANAPRLAREIDLSHRRHLLDLGGGPGTYAIHFCLANPGLTATVLDRATTREFAQQTAERFGVGDRIDFMAGDFTTDIIRGHYDVAWLSQILHSNSPEECAEIIARTTAALEPGGLLLVHEFFLDDSMDGPLFPALFSLNMLINNPGGRSYSAGEVEEMMRRAGLKEIRRLPFQGPNDSFILGGSL